MTKKKKQAEAAVARLKEKYQKYKGIGLADDILFIVGEYETLVSEKQAIREREAK